MRIKTRDWNAAFKDFRVESTLLKEPVSRLGLVILIFIENAARTKELSEGNRPFGVIGVGKRKIEDIAVPVGVSGLENTELTAKFCMYIFR